MNSNYVFTNQVSAGYANANIPPNNSWIQVDNNAGRPLYAQASYITNFDGLTVALTAGNVNIGDVHIADPYTGLQADVAQIGVGIGALRVLSQDLDSVHDSITIGDPTGNFAYVTSSALNVFTTNGISAVSVTNFPTQLTAVSITNFPTRLAVTNWDVLSAAVNNSTYTTLPSNPANEITILNNTGSTIYIKNASKSIGLPIDNNTSFDVKLVGDTSEVAVMASSDNKTVYGTFIAYN
jgi:hypothetical protein